MEKKVNQIHAFSILNQFHILHNLGGINLDRSLDLILLFHGQIHQVPVMRLLGREDILRGHDH